MCRSSGGSRGDPGDTKSRQIAGLKDSKLLTALQRERLYAEITEKAVAWAVVMHRAGGVRRARACTSPM